MKLNGLTNLFVILTGPFLLLSPEELQTASDYLFKDNGMPALQKALVVAYMVLGYLFKNPKFEAWLAGKDVQ